ncbi:MAG: N-acetylmuramoyl-L-alanine amidase [Acidimicrobiia bacterium]
MSYPTSVLVPEIRHRSAWTDVDAVGPLESEEVRFLIVHHTASSTQHEPEDVPGLLRGIRSFHVEGRGWNDIAYNFLIDRYGVVWEGRAGSLDGPVAGDATGGNQGFTQLVCLIGDFTAEPPSEPAQQSLIATLAWLADRYEIDVQSGMTISFVSRGSNRWPEGTQVTTAPIAGHRDMSLTSCPGDAFYPMLAEVITPGVNQLSTPTTSTTVAPTTSSQVSATSTTSTSTSSKSTPSAIPTTTALASGPAETDPPLIGLSVAAVAGGLLAGLIAWRMRRIGRR